MLLNFKSFATINGFVPTLVFMPNLAMAKLKFRTAVKIRKWAHYSMNDVWSNSPPIPLLIWYRYLYDLICHLQSPSRNWFWTQKIVEGCKKLCRSLNCISKIEFVWYVSMGKRSQKIFQLWPIRLAKPSQHDQCEQNRT